MSSPSFQEKSSAQWFYLIRGDASRHGLVNEVVLSKMATEGRLKPADLVWNKAKGDRWVSAGSIPGLCPPPEPVVSQQAYAGVPLDKVISRRHRSTFPILLVVGAALILSTSWACRRLYLGQLQLPPAIAQLIGVEQNLGPPSIDVYARIITLCLDQERVDKAGEMIIKLAQFPEYKEQAQQFRQRLRDVTLNIARREQLKEIHQKALALVARENVEEAEPLVRQLAQVDTYRASAAKMSEQLGTLKKERARHLQLEQALKNGSLNDALVRELVTIHKERKTLDDLFSLTDAVLHGATNYPPAACLAVTRVYLALEKQTHAKVAVQQFALYASRAAPADCLEAVRFCQNFGDTATEASILDKYVVRITDNPDAWIELAALRAQAGNEDAALDLLKTASKLNADKVRNKASDTRFNSIRDTWTFKRLTKPK